MDELVGQECARCDRKIASALDGMLCPECGVPVHEVCVAAAPGDPGTCETCGTPKKMDPESAGAREPMVPVEVEGVFESSVFARNRRPFPITGPGRVRLSGDGIEVSAFGVAQSLRSLGLLVVIVLIAGGAAFLIAFADLRWLTPIIGGAALWAPFSRMKARQGKPLSVEIPWNKVGKIHGDGRGKVLVRIRWMRPRGEITFIPEGDPGPVLAALRSRGEAPVRD